MDGIGPQGPRVLIVGTVPYRTEYIPTCVFLVDSRQKMQIPAAQAPMNYHGPDASSARSRSELAERMGHWEYAWATDVLDLPAGPVRRPVQISDLGTWDGVRLRFSGTSASGLITPPSLELPSLELRRFEGHYISTLSSVDGVGGRGIYLIRSLHCAILP